MSYAPSVSRAAADQPGVPHARNSVTTHELVEIPADMRGKFAWFQATAGSGASVDIGVRFGDATAQCVLTDRSGLSTAVLTADVNVPHLYLMASGQRVRIELDPSWTHFSHLGTGTTGCLRFGPAEGV